MDVILLLGLIALDLVLLGLVFFLNKQKFNPVETLKELNHERNLLKEVRVGIESELNKKYQEFETLYKKINTIAVEIEHSSSVQTDGMKSELENLICSISDEISKSSQQLQNQKSALVPAIQKAEDQTARLIRLTQKAEKICMFFSKSIPYEQVLEEIEDKKYTDARHLLAKGFSAEQVSQEIGLDVSEVGLIASLR